MIVVDTNVIAYLLLPGTHTAKAQAAFLKDPDWAAPILWRSEFRNVLAMYLRNGGMSVELAMQAMEDAETLLQGSEYHVPSARVLQLTADSTCSAYDCEFVALAGDLGVPLLTSDARIRRAFPRIAVGLADFASG